MGTLRWSDKLLLGPASEEQHKYCTSGGDAAVIPDREGRQWSETWNSIQRDSQGFSVLLCGVCGHSCGNHR